MAELQISDLSGTNFNIVEILLVEDNFRDAELMVRALRKQGLANQLFVAEDGEEALDFLLCRNRFTTRAPNRLPKVILLDLKLPKINGLEVLQQIKGNPITAHIPVVIITSSAEDPDITAAYKLGANSYVVKPVEFGAFLRITNELGFYWLLVNRPAQ
jgi:two-component system, response regulator